MHSAGVIRDEQAAPPEVLHQLRQIRLTREIRRRRPQPTGQLPPKGDFLGCSKDQPTQTERFTESFRGLAEMWPSLRRPVFSARAKPSNQRFRFNLRQVWKRFIDISADS